MRIYPLAKAATNPCNDPDDESVKRTLVSEDFVRYWVWYFCTRVFEVCHHGRLTLSFHISVSACTPSGPGTLREQPVVADKNHKISRYPSTSQ